MTHKIYPDPLASTMVYAELELFTNHEKFKGAAKKYLNKDLDEELRSFIYREEKMFRQGNIGKLFLLVDRSYAGIYDSVILAQDFFHNVVSPANKLRRGEEISPKHQIEQIAVFTENFYRQIIEARNREFFTPQ